MCRVGQEILLLWGMRILLKKESLPTDSVRKTSLQKMDHYCKSETNWKKVVKMTSIINPAAIIAAGLNQNQIGTKSKTTVSEISDIK